MVTIRDFFVEMGRSAEQQADRLNAEGTTIQNRQVAYDSIKQQFEAMAADGTIDSKELDTLFRQLAGAGLSSAELNRLRVDLGTTDSISGDRLSSLERAVSKELDKAWGKSRDQLTDLSQGLREAQVFIDLGYSTASAANKAEHDTSMAIIRNMAG